MHYISFNIKQDLDIYWEETHYRISFFIPCVGVVNCCLVLAGRKLLIVMDKNLFTDADLFRFESMGSGLKHALLLVVFLFQVFPACFNQNCHIWNS